ncbi:helix-turn-helix transcriptional regulator [Streptomyces sp. NBC_01433]|uniref:helix-turn-helix domain-containing protein n=1 Tax=Streptomyces sp. NBC_01433 TaxID=2903864 RepID=UPI002257CA2A|nr:helix-turn-helix transcriptional regulator [Streptomyces sp. NBC_01433]MCX4676094.1 helix-turn-helix transcriptional regulator [Streptomyces sp. NBC_01433]
MASAQNRETASPTVRLVAHVAKMARIRKKLTQEQLGKMIGYSAAAISAMESCAQPPSDDMLMKLEEVLGDGMGIFEQARLYMRMEAYPPQFKGYAPLEQASLGLQLYAPQVVHGLFQTERYARALIGGGYPPLPEARVNQLVEARMARKTLFDRDPVPLIEVILEETVLTRTIGSEDIMREQRRYLVDCAQRRNVTLHVLPLEAGKFGEYAGDQGSLNVLETPEHERLVYLEPQDESLLITDPPKVSMYGHLYAKIRSQTLGPRESPDLIMRLAGVEV